MTTRWLSRLFALPPVRAAVLRLPVRARRSLRGRCLGVWPPSPGASALERRLLKRFEAASVREEDAWRRIRTVADWETFRDDRLEKLARSLGTDTTPAAPPPRLRIGGRTGDAGCTILNVLYETAFGEDVTANLYLPEPMVRSMPGIAVSHGHHTSRNHVELQQLGIEWARSGCAVLVPDHVGHGERRQHPFHTAGEYPGSFRHGRQDYFFRYSLGMQLLPAGESLMGRMVRDLRLALEVLRSQAGVDPERIVLLGAVAGGGDAASVTAALDRGVAAVVPFNFGNPGSSATGETVLPGWALWGPGTWESTRSLPGSVAGGFAPWLVLAAVAPRRLVCAHEFGWSPEGDPVWRRLQRVYELYGATDRLRALHGRGTVAGPPPENSHCTNVGPLHRSRLAPILARWLEVPRPELAADAGHPAAALACTGTRNGPARAAGAALETAAQSARAILERAREARLDLPEGERRRVLGADVQRVLGDIDPLETPRVARHVRRPDRRDVLLEVEPDLEIGFTLLEPTAGHSERAPTVVGIAQSGARSLLVHRARLVRSLRRRGARVCLVDLRATGPSPGGDEFRGRHARSTIASSAALMLNDPIVAQQLRDLRTILCHLREEARPTRSPLVLWGDSTAAANGPGVPVDVPFDSGPGPELCEPMGPFLALLGGLFENDVRAVYAAGGLIGFRSILDSPFVHVPHDALTPGLLQVADVVDLVNALAPMPLRLEAFVDGRNRPVTAADLDRELGGAPRARRTAARTFAASAARASPTEVARWMIRDETGLPDDSGRPDGSTGNGAIRGPSIRARSP